jgi:hypothetical protein
VKANVIALLASSGIFPIDGGIMLLMPSIFSNVTMAAEFSLDLTTRCFVYALQGFLPSLDALLRDLFENGRNEAGDVGLNYSQATEGNGKSFLFAPLHVEFSH